MTEPNESPSSSATRGRLCAACFAPISPSATGPCSRCGVVLHAGPADDVVAWSSLGESLAATATVYSRIMPEFPPTVGRRLNWTEVWGTRGAEPASVLYARGRGHSVRVLDRLSSRAAQMVSDWLVPAVPLAGWMLGSPLQDLADVLVSRSLLVEFPDPRGIVGGLTNLVAPDGLLLVVEPTVAAPTDRYQFPNSDTLTRVVGACRGLMVVASWTDDSSLSVLARRDSVAASEMLRSASPPSSSRRSNRERES